MYYKDPNDSTASKITGSELKTKIREGFTSDTYKQKLECKSLEPIVKAALDIDFQKKQIEDFVDRLRNKAMPIKPTGYDYKISDYVKSKLGKAIVLDHHINRPGFVKKDFGDALDNFLEKEENSEVSKNSSSSGCSAGHPEAEISMDL